MWQFDYLWVFLLLPLPWLAYRFMRPYHEARSALRVPFFFAMSRAVNQLPGTTPPSGGRWQVLLNLLVWGLLLAACARPVLVEKAIEREQPIRDMLLAIDISQSMQAKDFTDANGQQVDRLSAVKAVVRDFIAQRKQDRIGLIVFGTGAYPQSPLTLDHASLSLLLDEVGVGMAGPNTAIGDAIGLAIKLLDQAKEQEKVMVLLSDGNDTGSAITPAHAAGLASERNIVVHTIGIGDPQASGEDKVDLQALEGIARTTGGRFFRADDRGALAQVYATLDRITPHSVKTFSHQPKRDLFWWPLGAALLLLALGHSLAAVAGPLRARPAQGRP
ncbi:MULTISPECIES: vWA domain-containing protein [Pseudomonas]|uniref:VWFA domain-containing protein n=1 Tax=Pseudomonas putida NBRC 14164 TaxID=1211579 RepID=A0ABM7EA23_PSEPU|nr:MULTISPECIES: VWA domain-containing protein [Pseudomonas]MCX9136024.1 VWA domain-containing protein [Pseudomonas sp. DCB_PUT]MDD1971918.1 VWA domain-containing protein [Pseudomonas putida]MDO1464116.1 VWA domain-containing protein [Pseudomonas putida]MDO1469493.1 VWA domain-containing protein [Pseudomonas putida]MDZ7325202.1 VWA domain-containing protein [Pseudomonas sp. SDS3-8]